MRWFYDQHKSSNGGEKSVKLQQSWRRVHILTFAISRTFPYMLTFAARKGRKKKKKGKCSTSIFCVSLYCKPGRGVG